MVAKPMRFRTRLRMLTIPLVFCACFAALIGCGGKKQVQLPPPTPAAVGWSQRGIASWYGRPYHGRRTSNGEVYDMNKLTAAHLSLPFNTWVRVTNLDNKKSVEVRINDRGPFIKRRIIDLSREGAKRIGMIGPGTSRVRVRVVATPSMAYKGRKPLTATARPSPPAAVESPALVEPAADTSPENVQISDPAGEPAGGNAVAPCSGESFYGVQLGSFQVIENAERMQGKITHRYGTAKIVQAQSDLGVLYRVIAGQFTTRENASDLQRRLRQDGIGGFITPVALDPRADCLGSSGAPR